MFVLVNLSELSLFHLHLSDLSELNLSELYFSELNLSDLYLSHLYLFLRYALRVTEILGKQENKQFPAPHVVHWKLCVDMLSGFLHSLSEWDRDRFWLMVKGCCLLFVFCLASQQHANVSQGRICTDNFTCCHTEIEVADQTFYLTQSQSTDTGSTSPSADPITPGAWQGSHWSANFEVTGVTRPRKIPTAQAGFEPWIFRTRGRRLNH